MKEKTYTVWNGKQLKTLIKGIKAINPIGYIYIHASYEDFIAWCKEQEFDPYIFTIKPFDNTDYAESEF